MEDSSWSSFAFLARIWQKQCQCKDSVCCRKKSLRGNIYKSIIINNRTNSIMNNNQYPSHPTTNFPHGQVPEREGWGGARICQRSPKACHKVEFFSSTGGIFLSPGNFLVAEWIFFSLGGIFLSLGGFFLSLGGFFLSPGGIFCHQLEFFFHQVEFFWHQVKFFCHQVEFFCHQLEFFCRQVEFFVNRWNFFVTKWIFLSPGGNGKNLGIWSKCKNLIHLMFRFEPGKCKEEETTETSSFR